MSTYQLKRFTIVSKPVDITVHGHTSSTLEDMVNSPYVYYTQIGPYSTTMYVSENNYR